MIDKERTSGASAPGLVGLSGEPGPYVYLESHRIIVRQIAAWVTAEFIADECRFRDPLPLALRKPIAEELAKTEYGWPTVEEALAFLDEMYQWKDATANESSRESGAIGKGKSNA